MSNNLYGGTLTLGNGFSSVLQQFKSQMNNAGSVLNNFNRNNNNSANKSKESWGNAFNSMNGSLNKFSNNTLSTISKITAGWLSFKGIVGGTKKILESGSEFQNASTFLDAVYKGNGAEKFKFATNFANKTPFEEGEVASSLAKAHALGLGDTEKDMNLYGDIGTMAKLTGNGGLSEAVDAYSDMMNGEFTRIQTIMGIKKNTLEDYGKSKNMQAFTNKQGQITNKDALKNVFESYMSDQGLSGLMERSSKTLSNRLSTLKGNFKKALAELGGIDEKGEVKDGSLFDQAGKGLEKLITSINNFAKSDSFEKIKNALSRLGQSILNGFNYITTHPELIDKILKLGGAFIGLKVVSSLLSPLTSLTNLFGSGSSGLGGIFTTLSKKSLLLAGTLGILGSVLSTKGTLHKGINSVLNDMAGNEKGDKKDYIDMSTTGLAMLGNRGAYGIASLFKNDVWKKSLDNQFEGILRESANAQNEINGVYDNPSERVSYETAMERLKNTTTNTNNTNSNKNEININIEKMEKGADINELMNEITKVMEKNNDRNAVIY